MKWSRRKFLAGALAAAAGGFVDVKWLEPRWLGVGRPGLKLGTTSISPIRLLHLSDFNASEQVSLGMNSGQAHSRNPNMEALVRVIHLGWNRGLTLNINRDLNL